MTVPTPVGVKDAEQLDVVVLTLTRAHGAPVNEPAAVPVLLNDTVPPGAEAVPVPVSLTKAVQLVACDTTMAAGEQDTTIDVGRPVTVTVLLALGPLPEWDVSVGV
jgi:hypothetical protein